MKLSEEKELLFERVMAIKENDGIESFVTINGCDLNALFEEGLGDAANSEITSTNVYKSNGKFYLATYACYDPKLTVEEIRELINNGTVLTKREDMVVYLKENEVSYYDEKLKLRVNNDGDEE